jgi:translation initiation factor 3 subunit A
MLTKTTPAPRAHAFPPSLAYSRRLPRAGLLQDAVSRRLFTNTPSLMFSSFREMSTASPQPRSRFSTAFRLLEDSFDPVTLCASTAPIRSSLCASDSPYAGYRPLLSRPLSQLFQVYSTVRVSTLLELVEAYVMGCTRRNEVRIRVDRATEHLLYR